jgi:hypothetical protein
MISSVHNFILVIFFRYNEAWGADKIWAGKVPLPLVNVVPILMHKIVNLFDDDTLGKSVFYIYLKALMCDSGFGNLSRPGCFFAAASSLVLLCFCSALNCLIRNLSYVIRIEGFLSMVADPHHINADPDPSFYFNADSDPAFHFNADPDPAPLQSDGNLRPMV